MKKPTLLIGLAVISCLLALSLPVYTIFFITPHFTEIVTFEKEVNAKQIANHITKMLVVDRTKTTLVKESITDAFVEIFNEARADFDLTKIKVFSSRGEVLYSTDAQEIGTVNTNTYFTDIVARGEIFSNVVRRDEKTLEDETVQKDVVETYVPLMRNGRFIGALEVYYDITYSGHNISRFETESQLIILVLTSLLLLCILLISLSAIRYRRKMLKAERKIQTIKDKLPPLYTFPLDD